MKKNVIYLLLADLIWGAAFVAQRTGGDVVGPYTFTCLRSFLGCLILIPLILLFRKKEESHEQSRKSLIIGSIVCGTALCLATNLQQLGITMGSSSGKAGFLTACYIILVPIFGVVIGKKAHWNALIGVVIAVVGLYLLCLKDDSFTLQTSDILLILCAVTFAIQILAISHFSPKVNALKLSCLQFLVCGIETLIPMIVFEIIKVPGTAGAWASNLSTLDAWIPLLYAGICSSGIAYTFQILGQRNFNPTIASLIMSLESVFAVLSGWVILHETLTTRELLGCAAIFAAVILAQINFTKRRGAN